MDAEFSADRREPPPRKAWGPTGRTGQARRSVHAGGAWLAIFSSPAASQSTASPAAGTAAIIVPLSMAESSPLSFGTVVIPLRGTSTISLETTDESRQTAGAAVALFGTASGRRYTLSGDEVSVSVPAFLQLTRTGAPAIAVELKVAKSIDSAGDSAMEIGGRFTISSTTAPGAYTGTYRIIASYN